MVFMCIRRTVVGCTALLATCALAACSALQSNQPGSAKPQVVAALYPYAYVAARVAGPHAMVTDLTQPGLEPHDVELTPQQVGELEQADLVVYERGFQPSVDAAVEQNPPRAALDVTSVVLLQPFAAGPAGEQAPSGLDPHLWLDPTRLIPVARAVAHSLATADPRHAADYTARANSLIRDLERLDAAFRRGLSHCQRTEFVASHAAFGYLARRYGLTMIAIAGATPEVEPSAQHLAQVQSLIESDGITTVFSERLGTSAYADTLASDLNLQTAVLDPIEGLASSDPHANYLTLMRANLTALRAANGCP
jgi:zinc transport system substrate-binding protein